MEEVITAGVYSQCKLDSTEVVGLIYIGHPQDRLWRGWQARRTLASLAGVVLVVVESSMLPRARDTAHVDHYHWRTALVAWTWWLVSRALPLMRRDS